MDSNHERYRKNFMQAYQIRSLETQLLQLFKEGKVNGTIHTSIGQEFSAVLVASHLREGDVVFSNHRCHGHYVAKTGDTRGLIAEVMGRQSGACRGFGGSQHLHHRGFFSNGIQGGIAPVSAGIALHQKLRGDGSIAVVYLGDGTFGEGVVYEALNLASLWSLPLLVVVEDNMYAQSTSSKQTFAGTFSGRASAFGIRYHEGSIWDLPGLEATIHDVMEQVRAQGQPAMLRIALYRLEAHSKGDDDRSVEEIAFYKDKDPLNRFLYEVKDCANTQQQLGEIREGIARTILEVEKDEYLPLRIPSVRRDDKSKECCKAEPESVPQVKAINAALDAFLNAFPTALLLGEDIHSPYGGAFKATKDLSIRYPLQVYTTPISEAGIVGMANGLALMAHKVVVEIMFGDFATLALDQIVNHAAKFQQMYGLAEGLPIVVRMPMGGGRGYGPTHSQCLEKHLAGIPGTRLFVIHGRAHVSRFYRDLLFQSDMPSIVIEHKSLYAKAASQQWPKNYELYESVERFPVSILRMPDAPDITLVAFGNMSGIAEQVAVRLYEEDEIVVELIFPLLVYPLDVSVVLESLRVTGRLVVVEEGTLGFDLGAEVVAGLAERWTGTEAFKVRRLAAKDMVIPSAEPLERQVLPTLAELHQLCLETFVD